MIVVGLLEINMSHVQHIQLHTSPLIMISAAVQLRNSHTGYKYEQRWCETWRENIYNKYQTCLDSDC